MSQSKPKISSLFLLWQFPSRPSGFRDSKCSDWNSLFGSCTGIMRKKIQTTWWIIIIYYNHSMFMTNWQHVFNLLLVVLSNFWLFESLWRFWCISKASFLLSILLKGFTRRTRLKIWSWWLRVWVPQHISMRFRLQKRCLADLKLLFARHLFKGSRVLVSTMYDHLPRDKYVIMLHSTAQYSDSWS